MSGMALGSLALGLLAGHFLLSAQVAAQMDAVTSVALLTLMLSVGIEAGANKAAFVQLRKSGLRILLIPFGVLAGSLAGGLLAGALMGAPMAEAGAVSSGFGFYSFSAVVLRELGGAQLGTVAFLSNLLRELLAFLLIPFVAKHCGTYAAIAPSGATAMDTTLPAITRAAGERAVLPAVISGAVLSALVPVLVPVLYQLLI